LSEGGKSPSSQERKKNLGAYRRRKEKLNLGGRREQTRVYYKEKEKPNTGEEGKGKGERKPEGVLIRKRGKTCEIGDDGRHT